MKTLKNIFISMRLEQWTKNIIIFAGLFFGKKLIDVQTIGVTTQVFAIFCIISSASYILNDVVDRKEDSHHPDKRNRPVARGDLGVGVAMAASCVLAAAGLIWAFALSPLLFWVVAVFLALHIAYDFFLKHAHIIDVFVIALSFIIRLYAGVILSPIRNEMSSWILLCTLLLSLFLALCKRRAEIALLMERSTDHRRSLGGYSIEFLNQLITIVGGCAIISYALYTLSPETIQRHHSDMLKYTIPFVMYGIFRYLYLVHMRKGGANPEKVILTDIPFIANMIAYCISVFFIVYRGHS